MRVKSIKFLRNKIPVYDITTKKNHNFIVEGLVVHNCDDKNLSENEVLMKNYHFMPSSAATKRFKSSEHTIPCLSEDTKVAIVK